MSLALALTIHNKQRFTSLPGLLMEYVEGSLALALTIHNKQQVDKLGSSLTKAATLRVNLNIDGAHIVSRTHTHPSHSQISCLLTSSLSLGVPVSRTTYCMGDVSLPQFSLLVFRHTDTFMCFLFTFRFIPS